MSFVCTTCDQRFETVPDDAVKLTPGKRRTTSFRFVNGRVHHLRLDMTRGNSAKAVHTRWHQTNKKAECIHCYPPPEPEASPELPVEQTELLTEVLNVIEELPEPPPAPVAVAPEPRPNTSMAAAFNRFFK